MPGFQVGGFLNAEIEDRMGVQIDFLWSLKGSKNVADSLVYLTGATAPTKYVATTKTYYRFVEVPVCFYFPVSEHIRGFAGPQLSFFRGAHETFKGYGPTTERDIKGISGKLSFCGGFDVIMDSPIIIGMRFTTTRFENPSSTGSSSQDNDKGNVMKLNSFMLNIAYKMDW
jgi:hypothetical protein